MAAPFAVGERVSVEELGEAEVLSVSYRYRDFERFSIRAYRVRFVDGEELTVPPAAVWPLGSRDGDVRVVAAGCESCSALRLELEALRLEAAGLRLQVADFIVGLSAEELEDLTGEEFRELEPAAEEVAP